MIVAALRAGRFTMGQVARSTSLEMLRAQIAAVERSHRTASGSIPFGVSAFDAQLPGGGLRLGALHEIADGDPAAVHGAAAVLFVAGVRARTEGPVLWCQRQRDLFAPVLAGVGLHPERVIYAEVQDEKSVLIAMEDGLRQGGLAGVVGEVGGLAMTPFRRLQLAAEDGGTTAFAVRRWRTPSAAVDFGQPKAPVSRWRISALPATREVVAGLMGRPRWLVEMMRCRGVEACEWELEACDETGRLAVPAELAVRHWRKAQGRDAPPAETPVVVAGRVGARKLVVNADRGARALGVHPGLAVAQAQASVPGLLVVEHALAEDEAALERIAL